MWRGRHSDVTGCIFLAERDVSVANRFDQAAKTFVLLANGINLSAGTSDSLAKGFMITAEAFHVPADASANVKNDIETLADRPVVAGNGSDDAKIGFVAAKNAPDASENGFAIAAEGSGSLADNVVAAKKASLTTGKVFVGVRKYLKKSKLRRSLKEDQIIE